MSRIDELLEIASGSLLYLGKALYEAVFVLLGLEISDHISDFTITGPYFVVSLALAIATSIVLILGRHQKWWLGFGKTVIRAIVWLIGAIAVVQAGFAKNVLPLHPTLTADTGILLFVVFLLLLPVAAFLLIGDWFKESEKLVETRFRRRQLRVSGNDATQFRRHWHSFRKNRRLVIATILLVLGLTALSFTPIFSNPSPTTANNRLVFAVAWLPVNNYRQSVLVDFNTVKNQLTLNFFSNGYSSTYPRGILYVVEPFRIITADFFFGGNWTYQPQPNQFTFPGSLGGLYGGGELIVLNYTDSFPFGVCSSTCQAAFTTEPMLRTDFNGVSSMEIPFVSLAGGNFAFTNTECPQNNCQLTGKNITTNVSITVPHQTSSLQASPPTSGVDFSQAFTTVKWDNLTSAAFMSFLSPRLLTQFQVATLTAGILMAQSLALFVDTAVRRNKATSHGKCGTQSQMYVPE